MGFVTAIINALRKNPEGLTWNELVKATGSDMDTEKADLFRVLNGMESSGTVHQRRDKNERRWVLTNPPDAPKKRTWKQMGKPEKVPCPYCQGLYDPRGMRVHKKYCPKNPHTEGVEEGESMPSTHEGPPIYNGPVVSGNRPDDPWKGAEKAMADDPFPQTGQLTAEYGAKIWNNLKIEMTPSGELERMRAFLEKWLNRDLKEREMLPAGYHVLLKEGEYDG